MDFDLTEAQVRRVQATIDFARNELNEAIVERDARGEFPRELWNKCARFGLLGLCVPQRYGGSDVDPVSAVATMEALGYACRDNGLAFAVNAQAWSVVDALVRFGSEQQKQRYLPGVCRGELIGAFAMTEPEAGSDCFALKMRAERDGEAYRLTGVKQLVTFAPVADFAIVFASTAPQAGRWGISAFVVDADTPGYRAPPTQAKMGLRTVPIGEMHLDGCRVPAHGLLGPEGAGASIFNATQETERALILASQVGAMRHQLEQSIAHASRRRQFGKPIGKFQSVSNRIVEMKLRLETSRLLLYKTAWLRQRGEPNMLESALTNLHLAESYVLSCLDAVRLRGGRGYLTEHEVERDLRDSMGAPLYGGTSDIQREIIARLLGL